MVFGDFSGGLVWSGILVSPAVIRSGLVSWKYFGIFFLCRFGDSGDYRQFSGGDFSGGLVWSGDFSDGDFLFSVLWFGFVILSGELVLSASGSSGDG
jgi:hypothetical protein